MPLNHLLNELLAQREPRSPLKFILELPVDQEVTADFLRACSDCSARVSSRAFNFVTVAAPASALPQLERLAVRVHYNMPRGIVAAPFMEDPILGRFSLSGVTVPYDRRDMLLRNVRGLPRAALAVPAVIAGQLGMAAPQILPIDAIIIPTGETRKLLNPPEDSFIRNTKVAVLDTGLTWPHPQFNPLTGVQPALQSTTGESPLDFLGHGQWCTGAAFGGAAQTQFGMCQGVATALGRTLLHVKCLSNLGFGSTESVLAAMEDAVNWGAKVISMSLGGPLQGGVEEDPECQIIKRYKDDVIFVVAAGNSGPESWTIGSPGASPYAITVGAYSTHYEGPAIFSSRGPNAAWYQDHPATWEVDRNRYGINLQKPDCVAPGGGPVEEGQRVDQIYSGVTGWTNGATDRNPFDVWDAMRGTSMATPHVAGLLALAYEHGMLRTPEEVLDRLRDTSEGPKSTVDGDGFLTFDRLMADRLANARQPTT